MQVITTKFFGPTDTKGARIKATCAAGSVCISYPYEANWGAEAHRLAMRALCEKLGWKYEFVTGQDSKGDYQHVQSQSLGALRGLLRERLSGADLAGNPYIVKQWRDAITAVATDTERLPEDISASNV